MPLTPGTRIGSYEVVSAIGAGGMGEVFRARDTKLNRIVAIKAVQELFAASQGSGPAPAMVERMARFDREAQLLASINHPNIAAIYGVEESQGSKFLVLEFVDGRPLSEILQGGALPVREALPIAAQIADALAAAHERGIIHRDLKPGNIMVTAEGQVKVLDFGLGKALESEASSSTSNSPTMTLAATQQGLILGTAGYMSPEQAKGRAADKRSDVWGFGVVLYEMVTGKRAFEGEDVTETLAAIVRGEPDWTRLPAGVPPQVRTLVERCLVKDRAQRLSDMSVVRFLLTESASGGRAPDLPSAPATARGRSVGVATAAVIVVVAVAATAAVMRWWPAGTPSSADAVRHLSIVLPAGDQLATTAQLPLAVSSDGTTVAYTATHDGIDRVYIRQLTAPETKMLAGTEGARSPFLSPDGQWVAFFAQGKLKKVALSGAGLQALADASGARGGCWGADGNLYS
ncbi:MAG: protein kinase, partial [Vicinamibacterales bacterium]